MISCSFLLALILASLSGPLPDLLKICCYCMKIYYNNLSPDCCCNYLSYNLEFHRRLGAIRFTKRNTRYNFLWLTQKPWDFFLLQLMSCITLNLQKSQGWPRVQNWFFFLCSSHDVTRKYFSSHSPVCHRTNPVILQGMPKSCLCIHSCQSRSERFTSDKLMWRFKKAGGPLSLARNAFTLFHLLSRCY